MKKILFTLLCLACAAAARGQVTLEECQRLARQNYPLIAQFGLVEKSTGYSISNARRGYLPQVSFSAQATYQSEVTGFPEEITDLFHKLAAQNPDLQKLPIRIKGLDKDQYKAMLEVNQTLWDGGAIRAQRQLAGAEGEVARQNIEVEMYAVRERINQLYFGILTLREQAAQNDLLQELLGTNYDNVKALFDNGVAMQGDLDQIRAEQLSARQQRVQIEAMEEAYLRILSVMTGRAIGKDETLEKPAPSLPAANAPDGHLAAGYSVNRPELDFYDAQSAKLDARRLSVIASTRPRFGAYIQGVYGIPGLNLFKDMLRNEASPYYIAGVRMQWNFGGFYTKKNNLRQLSLSRQQIENQKETFLFNTGLQATQERENILKMQRVMAEDDEIIALRTSIRRAAEAKLAGGTISVSDLLREINAENKAMQARSAHEIEWLKNIYDLKNTIND